MKQTMPPSWTAAAVMLIVILIGASLIAFCVSEILKRLKVAP